VVGDFTVIILIQAFFSILNRNYLFILLVREFPSVN